MMLSLPQVILAAALTLGAADPQTPEKLYEAGADQLSAEDYETALRTFRVALNHPDTPDSLRWRIYLGFGWAYEQSGRPGVALAHYERYLEATARRPASTRKERKRRKATAAAVRSLRTRLETTHGEVELRTEPPGASIRIDGSTPPGADPPRTPYRTYLPLGDHEVAFTLEGYTPASKPFRVAAGSTERVTVEFDKPSADPGPPQPDKPTAQLPNRLIATAEPGNAKPVAGWVTLGTGAATLIAGGVVAGLGYADHAELDAVSVVSNASRYNSLVRSRDNKLIVGWSLAGAGLAAVITGIVLVATAASDPPQASDLTSVWRF